VTRYPHPAIVTPALAAATLLVLAALGCLLGWARRRAGARHPRPPAQLRVRAAVEVIGQEPAEVTGPPPFDDLYQYDDTASEESA